MARFTQPTVVETALRQAQLVQAKQFVLTREIDEGGLVYDGSAVEQTGGIVAIVGDAADILAQMFAVYPTAGTNGTTTAVQSAINLTRKYFRIKGMNCDTREAKEGSFGAAFGLAMVYFHKAMQAIGAEEVPAA